MNVLAVDDQINVLNGLMVGVQWKKLGIDQVYKAGNAAEAKRILRGASGGYPSLRYRDAGRKWAAAFRVGS